MESHGALVGWTHEDLGDRILIRLQSLRSASEEDKADPDLLRLLMTKQQAAVLGNYLIESAGQVAPRPRARSWFRRAFG